MAEVPADPFICPCCGMESWKLRMLAEWFDTCYEGPSSGDQVQDDLRVAADRIEAGLPA